MLHGHCVHGERLEQSQQHVEHVCVLAHGRDVANHMRQEVKVQTFDDRRQIEAAAANQQRHARQQLHASALSAVCVFTCACLYVRVRLRALHIQHGQ